MFSTMRICAYYPKVTIRKTTITARTPEDTRPLSMSNTDAKILAGAVRTAAEPTIAKWALGSQRGFLLARHFSDNVIEVETAAVIASM